MLLFTYPGLEAHGVEEVATSRLAGIHNTSPRLVWLIPFRLSTVVDVFHPGFLL